MVGNNLLNLCRTSTEADEANNLDVLSVKVLIETDMVVRGYVACFMGCVIHSRVTIVETWSSRVRCLIPNLSVLQSITSFKCILWRRGLGRECNQIWRSDRTYGRAQLRGTYILYPVKDMLFVDYIGHTLTSQYTFSYYECICRLWTMGLAQLAQVPLWFTGHTKWKVATRKENIYCIWWKNQRYA